MIVNFVVFQDKEISQAIMHIKSRTREFENISAANAVECSMIERILFYNILEVECLE